MDNTVVTAFLFHLLLQQFSFEPSNYCLTDQAENKITFLGFKSFTYLKLLFLCTTLELKKKTFPDNT